MTHPDFPRESVLDLAAHIECGKSPSTHDIGWKLPDVLRSLQAKIDYLESVRPKTLETVYQEFHERLAS